MNRIVAPALLALALAVPAAAETRNLSGFSAVNASDRMTVEVAVGERYSVEVTGSDADRVRTRLDGNTLRITDARRPWWGGGHRLDARVRVTAPAINRVSASRGAELVAVLSGACD